MPANLKYSLGTRQPLSLKLIDSSAEKASEKYQTPAILIVSVAGKFKVLARYRADRVGLSAEIPI